jgi:hypothetical protein
MNLDQQEASRRSLRPAVYVIAIAALGLLAIGHGIGAVKHLKDGEWMWMGISFAVMGICATVAEYLYNAYRKSTRAR